MNIKEQLSEDVKKVKNQVFSVLKKKEEADRIISITNDGGDYEGCCKKEIMTRALEEIKTRNEFFISPLIYAEEIEAADSFIDVFLANINYALCQKKIKMLMNGGKNKVEELLEKPIEDLDALRLKVARSSKTFIESLFELRAKGDDFSLQYTEAINKGHEWRKDFSSVIHNCLDAFNRTIAVFPVKGLFNITPLIRKDLVWITLMCPRVVFLFDRTSSPIGIVHI